MQLKKFSKDELMEFLINGIPMPETALTNQNTIDFYFEELESFINGADNNFWASCTDYLEITIAFGTTDYIVMRFVGENIVFYMAPNVVGDIGNMTSEEASDIIGLVYGVIVYNEKWKEVSDIATQLISKNPSAITLTGGEPIKMNSIEMENLKAFVEENRKYK
jgi:hypothetical protein